MAAENLAYRDVRGIDSAATPLGVESLRGNSRGERA
jgi:hypothetical protein